MEIICKKIKFTIPEFKINFLMKNPYIQTLYGYLINIPNIVYTTEIIYYYLKLDWVYSPIKSDTVILICPGIGGRSSGSIVRKHVFNLMKCNYDVVVYTRTNDNVIPSNTNINEMDAVIYHISKIYKNIHIIGHSAGGNIILKYLGSFSNKNIKSAIVLSSGPDLVNFRTKVAFNPMLDHLLYIMNDTQPFYKNLFNGKKSILKYEAQKINTTNLYRYYNTNSSTDTLDNINIPVLYIASSDDPIMDNHQINIMKNVAYKNDNIITIITKYGGHLGWITTNNWLYDTMHNFITANN